MGFIGGIPTRKLVPCRLVCYHADMFYKNALFTMSQYWFAIYTGFSGQKFYIELATQVSLLRPLFRGKVRVLTLRPFHLSPPGLATTSAGSA